MGFLALYIHVYIYTGIFTLILVLYNIQVHTLYIKHMYIWTHIGDSIEAMVIVNTHIYIYIYIL